SRDARADVHRESGELVPHELAFPCVEACTYLEPEFPHPGADRLRAADRANRAVELGEESIAGRVDLLAPEARQLLPHERVVALDELAPACVAELREPLRRADDVGEENRGQLRLRLVLLDASYEPSYLREQRVGLEIDHEV